LVEDLYLATAKIIEYLLVEDYDIAQKVSGEEKQGLIKFFYATYERISKKQNCLTLKPTKLFNVHYSLVNSEKGIGVLHRALFQTQK
jgi:hypothetical protein